METANRQNAYGWLWIAGLWAALGILEATQNVFAMRHVGMHHSWIKLFIVLTFDWLPWALATPIVIVMARRSPPAWRSPRTWLMHIGLIAAIDFVASAWASMLDVTMQPWLPDFHINHFLVAWRLKIAGGLVPTLILYSATLAITYVLDSKARAAAQKTDTARLNEQLSYAQLNALQRQVEPHFVFNALNSIARLVREQKNDASVSMIVALADFLRRVAGSSHDPGVAHTGSEGTRNSNQP
ncbi:MAG TPA: histidine kinase [Steroidobacteraceae bacterium]|nr:histidine kinase [Steroidobacteraceae bacterium]